MSNTMSNTTTTTHNPRAGLPLSPYTDDVETCNCDNCGHPVPAEGVTIDAADDYDHADEDRPRCTDTACIVSPPAVTIEQNDGDDWEPVTDPIEPVTFGTIADAREALDQMFRDDWRGRFRILVGGEVTEEHTLTAGAR